MRQKWFSGLVLVSLLLVLAGGRVAAAPVPGTVHFSAAGDYAATANTTAVLNSIKTLDDDFHLALGDLSYGAAGQEQAWCDFVTSKVGAGYPFELLAGNHESNGINGNINDFAACLPNQLPGVVGTYGRQYYVDVPVANPLVRYVMISPNLAYPDGTWSYAAGSPRYQWTSQAIDRARAAGIPWVVVGMHKPCLTVGKYACDVGADLFNLLVSKRVDLVLSGHEHTYQRSKQLAHGAGCASVTPGAYNASCVADGDASLIKGAGTVAAVVGTGGNMLYDVNTSDPEAGYFAASSGANQNPTFGLLDMRATADSLQANFVRASGGTFADSFTITRSDTNQPPVASFTSSCTGLSCSFDASGSSDPDGTLSSYAWDFGDGATGTGATATHAYAAAGTFTVRLTVTDSAGVTATTTRSVTVTNQNNTTYVSDDFSRSVSSGFGAAPTGGAYSLSGALANYSVAGGTGNMNVGVGARLTASLNGVSAPSSDLRLSFALDKQPTGNGIYVSALGRRVSGASYTGKVRVASTGAVTLELTRMTATGSDVSLQPPVSTGVTHAVGDRLTVRLQVLDGSPTTIRGKVWKEGTPEPTAWQRTVTDSTAGLQTAGSVGVSPYLSSGASSAVLVKLDSLQVTAP